MGGHRRPRGARADRFAFEAVLGRCHRVRRRAQQPCLAGRCGDAGHAAGDQRRVHRAGRAHRPRSQGGDQPQERLRPQELLLPRSAAGLSDQPVQAADRRRGRGRDRRRRRDDEGRHRAPASGAGRRQVDPRPAPRLFLRRSQPLGRRADGDRVASRHALLQAGAGVRDQAAHHPALSRHLRRRHGEGQPARRRQRLGQEARRQARHALRDQERQLHPLHRPVDRGRGTPADRHPRSRRQDRPGDAAVRPRQGRDALHALQGRGARLPLFPRSRICCRSS